MNPNGNGVFYGVGVGPGDPDLITRKAERVLRSVDWIFHPSGGRSGGSFVQRIVEPLGLPAATFRPVSLCMSRDRTDDIDAYTRTAKDILVELRKGKSVAWITEGDPLFYSTFANLHERLSHHPEIKIEIVPGVPSTCAAAARIGWPIARLDERVAVVPAFYGVKRLPALLEEYATVFLLKVNSVFDQLLEEIGRSSGKVHAAYLENLGTPQERVVTDLESLRGQELSYFALVMVRRR
jgi:precorrin-2/cobalt-factor-2 C20-methyltransferase